VRRLENAATAPVLTCYRESYRHAATARALGVSQFLLRRLHDSIDSFVAAALAGAALAQWLALRLQLLSALLVAGLAFLAVAHTSVLPAGAIHLNLFRRLLHMSTQGVVLNSACT
jgi:hypothetical protein